MEDKSVKKLHHIVFTDEQRIAFFLVALVWLSSLKRPGAPYSNNLIPNRPKAFTFEAGWKLWDEVKWKSKEQERGSWLTKETSLFLKCKQQQLSGPVNHDVTVDKRTDPPLSVVHFIRLYMVPSL